MSIILEPRKSSSEGLEKPWRIKVTRLKGTGNEMWFLPLKREQDPNPSTSDKKHLATYGEQWDALIDFLNQSDMSESDGSSEGGKLYQLARQNTTPWSQCRVRVENVGDLSLRYRPGRARDTRRDIPLYGIWFDLDTGFEMVEGATARQTSVSPAIPLIRDNKILDFVFRTYGWSVLTANPDPLPEIALNISKYTSRHGFYLVVDLGNARTTCLAVVDPAGEIVNRDVRPFIVRVGFAASDGMRGIDPRRDVEEIVDSGFVLRDPITADWVQLTPDSYELLTGRRYQPPGAMMGPDVRVAREVYTEKRVFMSSPKRYIWDDEKRAGWEIGRRPWTDARIADAEEKTEPLSAHESVCLDLSDPAFVPRKYATVWLVTHILDTAVEAVVEHFLASEHAGCIPTLKGIRVTFPTGWGEKERSTYRHLWNRACKEWMTRQGLKGKLPSSVLMDLDTAEGPPSPVSANVEEMGKRHKGESRGQVQPVKAPSPSPKNEFIKLDLDEATASQLPILHDLIQSLGGNAAGFLSLLGSRDANLCRAMSLDIGGGSTDVAIVSYSLVSNANRLVSQRGVRFSSPLAGDSILEKTLAEVVLPAMWGTDKELQHALRTLFSGEAEVNTVSRAGLLTELFVPLVTEWFTKREKTGSFAEVATRLGRLHLLDSLNGILANKLRVSAQSRMRVTNFDLSSISTDRFREVVRRQLGGVVTSVSDISYHEKVDLMIVTGKTSELPEVQEHLREFSLLPSSRIVFAHGLPIGSWYPFRGNAADRQPTVVRDAKEMVVVGAALYTLIEHAALAAWSRLDLRDNEGDFVWMAIDRQMHMPDERHKVVSGSGQSFVNLMPGQMIGRKWKGYDVPALPLYRVHVPVPESANVGLDVQVNVEGQELRATVWRNCGQRDVRTDPVELRFQTIIEDTCWRDNGVLF